MSQYFKLVNTTSKEVISPAGLDSPAKFYEWIANTKGLLPLWLIRQSHGSGGGDIYLPEQYPTLGRWAGHRIHLVGDYDESKLYQEVKDYRDISEYVKADFNSAMCNEGWLDLLL